MAITIFHRVIKNKVRIINNSAKKEEQKTKIEVKGKVKGLKHTYSVEKQYD